MLFQSGSGYLGAPFAECEYLYRAGFITLSHTAGVNSIQTGSPVCRDVTQISGGPNSVGTGATATQSDMMVVPRNANAGAVYGTYDGQQGTITNPTTGPATAVFGPFNYQKWGYGPVLVQCAAAGVTVQVGGALIVTAGASGTTAAIQGTAAHFVNVGMALATGATTAINATLLGRGVGTKFLLINADIGVD